MASETVPESMTAMRLWGTWAAASEALLAVPLSLEERWIETMLSASMPS